MPPVSGDSALKGPLPALGDSDPAMIEALGAVAGGATVAHYLVPDNIIRHLVVTIDNLPRQKVPVDKRPTVPVGGTFLADGDELHATLDPKNFARYEPMVAVIRKLDMQQLAAVYLHFYPLFQRVYQDLGYPNGYFNDRLVQVIDSLLATPQPAGPIELTRPNVMYTFADRVPRGASRRPEAVAAHGSRQCVGDQGEALGTARNCYSGAAQALIRRTRTAAEYFTTMT